MADINGLATTPLDTWILYGLIIFIFLFIATRRWSFYWISAGLLIIFSFNYIYSEIRQQNLRQLIFYSVNSSWAIDFIEDKKYHSIADSILLADADKVDYQLSPYRQEMGLSTGSNNIKKIIVPNLGEVIVWHGLHILLANACLQDKDLPLNFDYVLYKVSRTRQKCYQEQILLRKFVNNQVSSYVKYNLRSQGALIIDI